MAVQNDDYCLLSHFELPFPVHCLLLYCYKRTDFQNKQDGVIHSGLSSVPSGHNSKSLREQLLPNVLLGP